MNGMTMKQWRKARFWELVKAYQECDPVKAPRDFILLSVALHAAKGGVPKSMWRYARRVETPS